MLVELDRHDLLACDISKVLKHVLWAWPVEAMSQSIFPHHKIICALRHFPQTEGQLSDAVFFAMGRNSAFYFANIGAQSAYGEALGVPFNISEPCDVKSLDLLSPLLEVLGVGRIVSRFVHKNDPLSQITVDETLMLELLTNSQYGESYTYTVISLSLVTRRSLGTPAVRYAAQHIRVTPELGGTKIVRKAIQDWMTGNNPVGFAL